MSLSIRDCGNAFFSFLDVLLPFGGYVLMWQSYFDESYTETGTPIICLAGYIFEEKQVRRLDRAWRAELARNELPYFHMVDCAHGMGVFAEGKFAGRSEKETRPERIKIQTRMIEIIKQRAKIGIAITITKNDFEAMRYRFLGTPYAFLASAMIAGVRGWIEENPNVDEMAYFFESGHPEKSEANYLVETLISNPATKEANRYAGHAFVIKEKTPAAQAADLLAWQWYKDRKKIIEGKERRKDCASLLEHPHHVMHWDKDAIARMINSMEERIPVLNAFTDDMRKMPAKALNEELWRLTLVASDRSA